ncbi:MAG TPA: thiopurine S-methyltransferase [Zoogloea sp.]|uniref:thiopurine S-methyltransferase n=1 Tax=Zoogloea sp. TaxID=49181 RepID=UPI002B8881E7|nr:thiopurine S-methyltransferase [Zoogloea sp.]HMV18786.1 thiopurine S-methyltransferase [Rhodocyclaceae bacterium]HMV63099.1 thiopurine S-methyltransferase [Rhodocyclaceae bacterium]HMW53067.1 thiopurine S-methyltransferase [Rhodocyclaceae bacterium]HMY50119.1 thiopurine S-methyltransferase [Rhodocyclaceae bacterium]HNA66682.1 thiopurine S-methyltransferase [Rhodocyclaceae bacterium]
MAHPDHLLWRQGWNANRIPFHLTHIHPLLRRFWDTLDPAATARVFVPLCGKSLDLMWLHGLGHDVVGIELSAVAVGDFFKAARLRPQRTRQADLTCWTQERLAIFCGDFFDLTEEDLQGVSAVYDRAALTALPEGLRADYVAHLHAILPAGCQVLLMTVEDLDDDEAAVEHMASSDEVTALYAGLFSVELLHAEYHEAVQGRGDGVVDGRCIHKVYRMRREARSPSGTGGTDA